MAKRVCPTFVINNDAVHSGGRRNRSLDRLVDTQEHEHSPGMRTISTTSLAARRLRSWFEQMKRALFRDPMPNMVEVSLMRRPKQLHQNNANCRSSRKKVARLPSLPVVATPLLRITTRLDFRDPALPSLSQFGSDVESPTPSRGRKTKLSSPGTR